ncbi:beta-glucanase precursor [Filimonas lacunae]|nr:beta-glucanase precursor [Filimonas lacunae]
MILTTLFHSSLHAQFLLLDDMEGNGPCAGKWDYYAGNTTTGKVLYGVNNPAPGGLNTSPKVAQFIKDTTSFEWMSAGCSLPDSFDLHGNTVFKLLVYSNVKEAVLFKLQPGTNYNKAVYFTYTIKNINTWEEASFDFQSVRTRTDLNRIEVHYADGKKANGILYFDLVQGPDPVSITVANTRITMGQEQGTVLQATVHGNTFTHALNKNSWTARWPSGVSIDSLQRVNDSVVNIVLAGNSTEVYSRYEAKLTIAGNQLDSSGAAQYTAKGTVVFAGNPSYTLIFADEFNGTGKPDYTKWTIDPRPKGWINGEQQVYTDSSYDNARMRNGCLVITGRKDYPNYNTTEPWSSGRVITQNKVDFKYGKVEVRARLPRARGSWPAIWLMPTTSAYGDWPKSGELDVMEHVGNNFGTVLSTVHTQNNNWMNGSHTSASKVLANVDSVFHVYAMEWNEDSIRFTYDGVKCYTYVNPKTDWKDWPFDQKFHIILNVAIGGGMGGAITEADWPDSMLVDYVRVYQQGIGTPVLDSISLTPANRAYISGKSYQYTSKVFDQNDFPLPVTPVYSITGTGNSITTGGRATVAQPGTITATAIYNGDTIRATANATLRAANYKPVPARIEAEAFDYSNTCCTETAQDTSGVLDVSYIANTSFMEYDIQTPWAGSYRLQLRVAVNTASSVRILLGDSLLTTLQLPASGGWQNWITVTTPPLQLPGGNQTLVLQSATSGWNFNWLKVIRATDVTLARIAVTPDSTSVFINARKPFKAAAYASDSSRIDLPFTWSVPTKAGVIDTKGVITASDTPGVYYVKAHYNSMFGKAKINVLALPKLARIKVVPDSLTLPLGASQQYTTQGFDQYGSAFAFTGATWSVTGTGNTVSSTGVVTATTNTGSYTVTATKDSISGTALFTTGYGCTFKKRIEAESSTSRSTVPTLETTTDTSGGQNFTGIGYNHWFGYSTLGIPVKGRYNVSFRVLTTAPAQVKLANTGVVYGIINLPNTNGQWATITDTMTIPAISYANVIQHSGTFKFNWFAIDNCANAPAPDSSSLRANTLATLPGKTAPATNTLQVYPNPVNETITIETGNRPYKTMQLLDMSGRLLQQWPVPAGATRFTTHLGNIPVGNYIIRLQGNTAPASVKIIKQ